ncbi:MAG: hypothetical protein PVH61_37005 [Candidatus Aminicenantes bacterium]|jgi:hypothetical protein
MIKQESRGTANKNPLIFVAKKETLLGVFSRLKPIPLNYASKFNLLKGRP